MVASAFTPTGRRGRLRILVWVSLFLTMMLFGEVHAGLFQKKQEKKEKEETSEDLFQRAEEDAEKI
ncbi:MAG: hypothetical protein ACWGSD_07270, partial [Thermodesulfobacteriota bacterium]